MYMQPQSSPTEEAAASGSSCGNDNMTPEEIGLVEMTCEAILEGDDPELEEMDDPRAFHRARNMKKRSSNRPLLKKIFHCQGAV